MAEQEACTQLVEKASQEQSSGLTEGESLLLPLLQGLLETPEKEQTADSGIESGEDQRSGLIAEVQSALEKLSASLCNDTTDITPERRDSLLQLVTRLQAGLSSTVPKLERRLSSGPGRFNKRKNRQNRHTVGVSSEELADARRLMEEISVHDIAPSHSSSKVTLLQKQSSESSVTSNSSVTKFGKKTAVKNATAKPFTYSSNSISNASSVAQTPTDPSEHLEPPFVVDEICRGKELCHEIYEEIDSSRPSQPACYPGENAVDTHKLSSEGTSNFEMMHEVVKQAATRKKGQSESKESETEDSATIIVESLDENQKKEIPVSLKLNPTYVDPNDIPVFPNLTHEQKVSRFNTLNKKLKMKRANTIDIPKALKYYEDENDSELSDEEESKQHRSNYYALRGPIRVGNVANRNSVPVFEPKTESDQRFLAFINKNNQDSKPDKASLWTGQKEKTTVWSNKFGNIKNNFEKASFKTHNNSARNFWKTQDDSSTVGSYSQFGPKISKKSARNLQQMFEEKQRNSQERPTSKDEINIVTGSLTVKIDPEKTSKFLTQPLPMNKFSHAPQSAFKPIPKKNPVKPNIDILPGNEIVKTEYAETRNDTSLFLYSPKPLLDSRNNSSRTSPVNSKPWVTNVGEHGGKIFSIAAKRFEMSPQPENIPFKPRKLSKELNKVFFPQPSSTEKLNAPYLVKCAEQRNSTVRKLSDQYDNMSNNIQDLCSNIRVKYQPTPESKSYSMPPHMHPEINMNKSTPIYCSPKPDKPTHIHNENLTSTPQYSYIQKERNALINKLKLDNPITGPDQSNTTLDGIGPEAKPIFQHVPGKEGQTPGKSYTSTFQLNNVTKSQYQTPPVLKIEPVVQPPKLQSQLSTDSLHEYNAINSKVMSGPVSQNAVTIRQKSPMSRDAHDMNAAFNLKNVLQKVSKGDPSPPRSPTNIKRETNDSKTSIGIITPSSNISAISSTSDKCNLQNMFKNDNMHSERNTLIRNNVREIPKPVLPQNSVVLPSTSKYKLLENTSRIGPLCSHNENKTFGVVKPMQQKPVSATPIYNNVTRIKVSQPQETITGKEQKFGIHNAPTQAQVLKKSDSWNQICVSKQMTNRTTSSGTSPMVGKVLRSKSSHALAVPQKQYEAGISRDDLSRKKKTVEAYFSGGNRSPQPTDSNLDNKVVKRSINRIKTSEKVSTYHQSPGLARSRTLPDIVCPPLLDESNVDQAFEDLFKSNS